jgi:hypothetical protein
MKSALRTALPGALRHRLMALDYELDAKRVRERYAELTHALWRRALEGVLAGAHVDPAEPSGRNTT